MDLGATICLARAPRCLLCPVRGLCAAAQDGNAGTLSGQDAQAQARPARATPGCGCAGATRSGWCSGRRAACGRPVEPARVRFDEALERATAGWPGRGEALPAFVHVLTHFDWHLQPLRWTLPAATSARSVAALTAPWPEAAGSGSRTRWRWACRRRCASCCGRLSRSRGRRSVRRVPHAHQRIDDVEPRERVEAHQPLLGGQRERQDLAPAVGHPAGVVEAVRLRGTARAPCADSVAIASTRLLTTSACVADGATSGSSASGLGVADPQAVGLLPASRRA